MSVTMTRSDGVTVLTLTPDPQSSLPPICQILRGLCYSPVCCSVSQRLRKIQGTSQSVLGLYIVVIIMLSPVVKECFQYFVRTLFLEDLQALHIMVGLLNIGLGAILLNSGLGSWRQMDEMKYPIWMGVLFIFFGIMNILSEKFPSPCLVILSVILNLSGFFFAIAAFALYIINITNIYLWWMCRSQEYDKYDEYGTSSLEEMPKCLEAQDLVLMILRSINAVLIILSVLELCVTISSAVLGIKALKKRLDNKSLDDPEQFKPLPEEGTSNPVA